MGSWKPDDISNMTIPQLAVLSSNKTTDQATAWLRAKENVEKAREKLNKV